MSAGHDGSGRERARGRPTGREAGQRHRRLAEVFGDVLPEESGDDRADAWGDPDRGDDGHAEEWWRGEVPPHHGS